MILEVANREHNFELTGYDGGNLFEYQTNQFVDCSPLAFLQPDDLQGIEFPASLNWLSANLETTGPVEFVQRFTGLEWLSLSDVPIDNLDFLEFLPALKGLVVSGCAHLRLSPLHRLTELRYLFIGWTEFFDFEYLEDLVNLEILAVNFNEDLLQLPGWWLWEANVNWLANMPNLRLLNLRYLDVVSDITLADIKEKLCSPNCKVWF